MAVPIGAPGSRSRQAGPDRIAGFMGGGASYRTQKPKAASSSPGKSKRRATPKAAPSLGSTRYGV